MLGLGFENTRSFLRSFKDDTRGGMTVFGLFFFLFSGILGAIALDVTSLCADRTHLQVAADQAAHTALYQRAIEGLSDVGAKTLALSVVEATLPAARYGVTIEAADIEFGVYDAATRVFTPDNSRDDAIRVLNFVPVAGHWGTLPQSVKGAPNGTTSTQLYRRL